MGDLQQIYFSSSFELLKNIYKDITKENVTADNCDRVFDMAKLYQKIYNNIMDWATIFNVSEDYFLPLGYYKNVVQLVHEHAAVMLEYEKLAYKLKLKRLSDLEEKINEKNN